MFEHFGRRLVVLAQSGMGWRFDARHARAIRVFTNSGIFARSLKAPLTICFY
jgi:hypothetical protein